MPNPLHDIQEKAGATFVPAGGGVEVIDTFGPYEAEYAVIRKGVGVLHLPQRGVVEVTGGDRLDFLHRMLTHDMRSLTPGQARRAFLLGKTGRIEADMVVVHDESRTLLELDRADAPAVAGNLTQYLFTEDVALRDASDEFARLSLHGPAAAALLGAVGAPATLDPWRAAGVTIRGAACGVFRRDETGAPGLHLLVPAAALAEVYAALCEPMGGVAPAIEGGGAGRHPVRGRAIGWAAYNTARIEAGSPLFHIDFGPDSLPHETGLVPEAVSFTKGCYLGQEIVARMHNLGHPKRVLVGLRFADDRMPLGGTQVLEQPAEGQPASSGAVIGAVTSATLAPMLGGVAVAFAVLKWGKHRKGLTHNVPAEGTLVPATVTELRMIP